MTIKSGYIYLLFHERDVINC